MTSASPERSRPHRDEPSTGITIVGAGAVGLMLAGRLALSGARAYLVGRRPDALATIARDGLRLEDPATGVVRHATGIETRVLGEPLAGADGPILVCVRAGETAAVGRRLADAAPGACVVSAQNDVDNETILAGCFERVLGLVVRQTCTLAATDHVLATGRGRLVVGCHPRGLDGDAHVLADRLEDAGFDVGRSDRITTDKWLKLCVNGTSAVNALVRREDHRGRAFVTLKIRLFEESRDVLAAAGIEARSCDGRDRDPDAEITALKSALEDGSSARDLPLYNACWSALRDPTRPLEVDVLHRRLIALGERHGVPTPTHAAVLEAVTEAHATARGAECLDAETLLARAVGSR